VNEPLSYPWTPPEALLLLLLLLLMMMIKRNGLIPRDISRNYAVKRPYSPQGSNR